MTKIFIFEFKSWTLVFFHGFCLEATQRIVTCKNNSLFKQCFIQFKQPDQWKKQRDG